MKASGFKLDGAGCGGRWQRRLVVTESESVQQSKPLWQAAPDRIGDRVQMLILAPEADVVICDADERQHVVRADLPARETV
jgi:hypothetical protein